MMEDTSTFLKLEAMQQRLEESEQILSKANKLADNAYSSLATGDVQACQVIITQLICSISEHFYEELH